ncbi:hypothetical protein ScPMuIL_017063 [Solemya velum]
MEKEDSGEISLPGDVDSCGICLGTFKNPKILPCFHSYCSHCLEEYVDKTARNKHFTCPMCLSDVTLPVGGVDEFQTNFYIRGRKARRSAKANTPCDVCEQKLRADNSCLECEQNLCTVCSKSHLRMTSSRDHHLVSLSERDLPQNERLTARVYCEKHKADELCFYCEKCSAVICLRCKVTTHENHPSKDLSDVALDTRAVITGKIDTAKTHLPALHDQINKTNVHESEMKTTRENILKVIKEAAQKLHADIDNVASGLLQDVRDECQVEAARIEFERLAISNKAKSLSRQLHTANQVVNYASDAELAKNKDELVCRLDSLTQTTRSRSPAPLSLVFQPSEKNEGSLEELLGSLRIGRSSKPEMRVETVSQFRVEDTYKVVSSICPTAEGHAWVTCGWKSDLHLYSKQGEKIKSHNFGKNIDTIFKDQEENLFLCSSDEHCIVKLNETGGIDVIVQSSGYPRGVALTRDRHILVCCAQTLAFQDFKAQHNNKVVKYTMNGKLVGEVGAVDALFKYPIRVAENITGDICVADCHRRCVIIYRPTGLLKATYAGTTSGLLESPFDPRGIVCDERGNLLIADNSNGVVHVLDHCANFLQLLLTGTDAVPGLYAIGLGRAGCLWVGGRDGAVKVFRYS